MKLLLALALTAIGLPQAAQQAPKPPTFTVGAFEEEELRGLKEVSVLAEDPAPEGTPCNLTRSSLELAATRPLLDGGIKVTSTKLTQVYVNVTVLRVNAVCVAHVLVQVNNRGVGFLTYQQPNVLPAASEYPGIAFLAASNSSRVASERKPIVLLDEGSLLTGPALTFGDRVGAEARKIVDEFVTKVKLQNQPK